MSTDRTYDDPCGVARALDMIGERWALLVVRELLLGPKRFTDLRAGLPAAGQNVLSHRLRELEHAGVVRRAKLGPPSGARVYELTDRGHALEPVLLHLGRWGSRSPVTTTRPLGVDALMLALRTTFDAARAGSHHAALDVHVDGDRFRVEVARGELHVTRGGAPHPDAVVETDAETLRAMAFGRRAVDDAVRSGDARVSGDRAAAEWFCTLFPVELGTTPS